MSEEQPVMPKTSKLSEYRENIRRRSAVGYRPEYCDLLVEYATNNPDFRGTIRDVAEFIGCGHRSVSDWRNVHPEFNDAFKAAQQIVVDRALEGLVEAALGAKSVTQRTTTRPDGTVSTDTIVRKDPPNVQASMFLLKNLRPNEWKERRDLDIVSDGEAIRPVILFAEPKTKPAVIDVTPKKLPDADE